uniref:Limbic system-associated membrane protein n=2 Tax=Cacopsylla melanoneura TaxID=428564 RepID=A0A8D8SUX1_9HEMI
MWIGSLKILLVFSMHLLIVMSQIDRIQDPDKIESYINNMLWFDHQSSTDLPTREFPQTSTEMQRLPFFEDDTATSNITVQYGVTVILECRVIDLLDKTVSWLKRHGEKLDLLTWGPQVYAKDNRYEIAFLSPNNWQLKIKYVNERDQGHYECQISSHPPLIKQVYLIVVVPEMDIADERGVSIKNKYYNSGSTIELKCTITKIPHPNHFIVWTHGSRVLNYDTTRGGISVKTDMLQDGAKSRLFIANAVATDSGNYTCSMTENASTMVLVHVLNGETPAAMQHGGSCRTHNLVTVFCHVIFYWVIMYLR